MSQNELNRGSDLHINALIVNPVGFRFNLYIRTRTEREPVPAEGIFSGSKNSPLHNHWISFVDRTGFEALSVNSADDLDVASRFIFYLICERAKSLYSEDRLSFRLLFPRALRLILRRNKLGAAEIILQPQTFPLQSSIGVVVEFHFHPEREFRNNREVQRMSYSLDSQYRANRNFHIDKHREIETFVQQHGELLDIGRVNGSDLRLNTKLLHVRSEFLDAREFICGGKNIVKSAREGLQSFGPHTGAEQFAFYFIFREPEREEARLVLQALQGTSFPHNFPGMKAIFGIDISNAMVKGRAITGNDLESIIAAHISECRESPIPVVTITVFRQDDPEYLQWKKRLTQAQLPMQQVDRETARNSNALKFAVYNIALQIFAKAGGIPWLMKTKNHNCLIIGFGQAHDRSVVQGRTVIRRYLSYSVLTDSSGKFRKVVMLGKAVDENDYLKQFLETTSKLLREEASNYTSIVLHIPFRIKIKEYSAIRDAIQNQGSGHFVVIRVNEETQFFGYDYSANSLVPRSGSYVQVSENSFLVWYDGIVADGMTVSKRYSPPLFISFDFETSAPEVRKTYLQDIINLSGANWRGLGTSGLPVSIRYCQLVAKFLKRFEAEGSEVPEISTSIPWFL